MADKKTILIVDDQASVRDFLKVFLKDDYEIIEASSKEEGLKRYDENKGKINLVVTDCDMEKAMIGFDLISDIRKRGGDIPIIMLSGGQSAEKQARLESMSGNNEFMDKTEAVGIAARIAAKLAEKPGQNR